MHITYAHNTHVNREVMNTTQVRLCYVDDKIRVVFPSVVICPANNQEQLNTHRNTHVRASTTIVRPRVREQGVQIPVINYM